MEAIKATTARRGRRLARASSSRVMFICAAMKRARRPGKLVSFVVSSDSLGARRPARARAPRSLHHRLVVSTDTRRDSMLLSPFIYNQIRTSGILGSFSTWWKHTGAAPLMANRLTPAPWQSRIRPNPSQSGTRSHSVEYSSKLRDTQGHSRGGRYSNQDCVQSACNPLGTPICHLRETHGNHSHSQ